VSAESPLEKETTRLEAFSDGVFTIALTLLVLELTVPTIGTGTPLSESLLGEWPSFFALVTSFMTILIMWMNHHNMFRYIRRIDRRLMLLNGLLLLFVVLTPFTTSLVAHHLSVGEAETAAGVYSGNFLFVGIVWNVLWRYCSRGHRLLADEVTEDQVTTITRQYYVAPLSYGSALVISQFSGFASVAVVLIVAAFYAITATLGE
jgi:uncharacterized membrane protein